MKIAIHQPNYFPWSGYFAKLLASDVFVFLDDVQYIKDGYIQRTRIRGGDEAKWLSCSVKRPSSKSMISEVIHTQDSWVDSHVSVLTQQYSETPFFKEVMEVLLDEREELTSESLAVTNRVLVRRVVDYLELERQFVCSSDLEVEGKSSERLVNIVKSLGGKEYLSGKGAEAYMDYSLFTAADLKVTTLEYRPITYEQRGLPWLPGLSILDVLFNLGKDSRKVLCYQ